MARITVVTGLEHAKAEARAYWRARNQHCSFVVVIANEDWLEGFQESMGRMPGYSYPDFAGVFRANLVPWFSFAVTLYGWQVEPNLTPYEQDNADYIYMVVDSGLPKGMRVAIVIIHDPEELGVLDRKAIRVPAFMTDRVLFQMVGCETKCTSSEFLCIVEYGGSRFPPGAYFEVQNGMKLVISIFRTDQLEKCPLEHLSLIQRTMALTLATFVPIGARVTDQHGFVVAYDLQEEEERLVRLHNTAAQLQAQMAAWPHLKKVLIFRSLRQGRDNRLEYSIHNALDILLDLQAMWPDLWEVRFLLEKLRTPRSMQITPDTMVFMLRTVTELNEVLSHPYLLEVVTAIGSGAGSSLSYEETSEEQTGAKIADRFHPGWCPLQAQCELWIDGASIDWQTKWRLQAKAFVQIVAPQEHQIEGLNPYRVLAQYRGGRLMAIPARLPDRASVIVFHPTADLYTEVYELRVRWYFYPRWIQVAATAHWEDLQIDPVWNMITVHDSRESSRTLGHYLQVLLTKMGTLASPIAIVLVELDTPPSLGTTDCHAKFVSRDATACNIVQAVLHNADCTGYIVSHNGLTVVSTGLLHIQDGDYFVLRTAQEECDQVSNPDAKRPRRSVTLDQASTGNSLIQMHTLREPGKRRDVTTLQIKGAPCCECEPDHSFLMQRPRAPFLSQMQEYIQQFTLETVEVTFWLHGTGYELVQSHSVICQVHAQRDAEDQRRELWTEMGMPTHSRVTPVDPAPVFITMPRPHMIVTATFDPNEIPVLCRTNVDGRYNLLSISLSIRSPPVAVSALFAIAIPQHDCEHSSECYMLYNQRRFEYRHDVDLHHGAFVRLSEWTQNDILNSSTSCGESEVGSGTLSWHMKQLRLLTR